MKKKILGIIVIAIGGAFLGYVDLKIVIGINLMIVGYAFILDNR